MPRRFVLWRRSHTAQNEGLLCSGRYPCAACAVLHVDHVFWRFLMSATAAAAAAAAPAFFVYGKALAELSESPEVITQKPAFIVFMEGGDKEEQVRGPYFHGACLSLAPIDRVSRMVWREPLLNARVFFQLCR